MKLTKNKKDSKTWLMRLKWVALLLIFAYFCFGGNYNLYNFVQLKIRAKEARDNLKLLEIENQQLNLEINKLKNDLAYIEKIAREKYHLGKPGEKVYFIKGENSK